MKNEIIAAKNMTTEEKVLLILEEGVPVFLLLGYFGFWMWLFCHFA